MQAATDVKFKVGDKAVYPAQGVAEVIRIEEKDIAGSRQKFYVLRILDTDRKILVPVANAGAVGLRQVISEQEIREIFDILRERTIAFDNQTWNRRYRGFMDKIKTGSIYDVAEVLRDLYRLKTDKQLSFGERRMLDTARTLIVKEIAIAREADRRSGQGRDRGDLRRELIPASRGDVVRQRQCPGASRRQDAEVPVFVRARAEHERPRFDATEQLGGRRGEPPRTPTATRPGHCQIARPHHALDAVDQLDGATEPRGRSSGVDDARRRHYRTG